MFKKDFAVIIPAYRGLSELSVLLETLENQSIRPKKTVVIDSSPEAELSAVARAFGAEVLRVLPKDFNHGLTRTLAARQIQAEFLVFLTQDARPAQRDSLARLLEAFEDPRVGAAYGRQLSPPALGLWAVLHRLFNYPPQSRIVSWEDRHRLGLKAAFFSNSFGAYRRKALAQIGWFPEVPALEDVYACASLLKKGWRIAYVADATVWHGHRLSLWQEFKRYRLIGAFYRKHPWILKECGPPSGEGLRYFAFVWRELGMRGQKRLFPAFVLRQAVRLLGYLWGLSLG